VRSFGPLSHYPAIPVPELFETGDDAVRQKPFWPKWLIGGI
jgi:hypothetical protein